MIDVRVLAMRPHPDQATHNPGCWAIQLRVAYAARTRTFWRWYKSWEEDSVGRRVPSKKKPSVHEVLEQFWDDTFGELHGFDFEEDAT